MTNMEDALANQDGWAERDTVNQGAYVKDQEM
jgi:hypothetical protein